MAAISDLHRRVGSKRRSFECCDTTFEMVVSGICATVAARRAHETVLGLEAELDAFDPESAVSHLNDTGRVENEHVAAIVERGLEYVDRTDGRFDIRQGDTEHALKAYLRGDANDFEAAFSDGRITIDGHEIRAEVPLDLNGLAKGYIVDRATDALQGIGRRGYVNGGGDMTPPLRPVAIESPYGDEKPLRILDTDWAVASSGNYNRYRGNANHIYDPTAERIGARSELVTVLAQRDCMEADAVATTLATMHPDDAIDVANEWTGVEAFLVHEGVFHQTEAFTDHVYT